MCNVLRHACTEWHMQSDVENYDGWLSPGGHSSGGRALITKVRGPRFNPRWLLVFTVLYSPKPFSLCIHVSSCEQSCLKSLFIATGPTSYSRAETTIILLLPSVPVCCLHAHCVGNLVVFSFSSTALAGIVPDRLASLLPVRLPRGATLTSAATPPSTACPLSAVLNYRQTTFHSVSQSVFHTVSL